MTEVCSAVQSVPDEDINYAIETVGKIMDHTEAKVKFKSFLVFSNIYKY